MQLHQITIKASLTNIVNMNSDTDTAIICIFLLLISA